MAADKYVIPSHLDDPELIGLWTLDEFLAMVLPFVWGSCLSIFSSAFCSRAQAGGD
jgi:type IV conjugative transfer system protein TraL